MAQSGGKDEGGAEMTNVDPGYTPELRERAIKQLKKRRDFRGHLLIYTLVNSFLVVIWAMTNADGFFWPIFPIVGWGIGVIMNAWDVYGTEDFSEDAIEREIKHLAKR
jgi:2TM domain